MTIADMLYIKDRQILLKIVIRYRLVDLARTYFAQNLAYEEESGSEYSRLMMPRSYSGRVQRDKGALTQKHYQVIK
jgi:hypothetical protein